MQAMSPVMAGLKEQASKVSPQSAPAVAAVRDGDPGADSFGAAELLPDVRDPDRVPGLQTGAGL